MILRHPNAIESLRQARRSTTLVRQKLLNPTPKALDSCAPHLQVAIDSLARLQHELETSVPPVYKDRNTLQSEMSELWRELSQISALMNQASAFHAALSMLLFPPPDEPVNYMPGAIARRPASTLQLEG